MNKRDTVRKTKIDCWTTLLYFICGLIGLFLLLPIFVTIPMSFSAASYLQFPPPGLSLQWYQKYFLDSAWISATWISFQVAIVTMIFSTVLGTLASLALVREKFRGKTIINTLIMSPMIIPVIVISVVLYGLFSKTGLIGSKLGLVLGHSLLAIPFVVITLSAGLKGFDVTLERAAMGLGATRIQSFLKITFPLIRPSIFSAALFSFVVSFDEIVISMFLCGITAVTLPLKMWEGIRMEINPVIAAVSTMLICLSVLLLSLVEYLRPKTGKSP